MYVQTRPIPDMPPPPTEAGVIGWLRHNLFSSWLNASLTACGLALLYLTLPPFLSWAVFKANWLGVDRAACVAPLGNPDGACWVFVKARFGLLMYGFYPEAERWRIDFALLLFIASAGPLIVATVLPSDGPYKERVLGLIPPAGIALAGICFGPMPACVAAVYLLAPWALSRMGRARTDERTSGLRLPLALLSAAAVYAGTVAAAAKVGTGLEGAAGFVLAAGTFLVLTVKDASALSWRFLLLVVVYPCLAYGCFLGGGFGLDPVETDLWGGMFLTLVIGAVGIATSLPIGVLLALGRRSDMPVIRTLCIGFIEFIRGVPLISVLFMVSVMLPLTLPEGVNFDKLLRALVGVSLFYAAYMAEVVRGGLQAVPRGQLEAAQSMGLGYWKSMRLVVLPQALRMVIPGITNTSLGLAKDTTLVTVINLMDLLGILKSALADSHWLGFAKEAYVFAGLAFWVICFVISRTSMRLERRLSYDRA